MRLVRKKIFFVLAGALSFANPIFAQDLPVKTISFTGSLQSDMLFPQEDASIGTGTYDQSFLSNTYLDLNLQSQYVSAGARLELLNNPLPGFEDAFSGAGLPHVYVTARYKFAELTVGDFYDQFGSGFVFRAYEDRSLGIDNSLRGARLVLNPYRGIHFKALGGQQRVYFNFDDTNGYGFDYSKGCVWGADLELGFEEWMPQLLEQNWHLTLGGSFVSRYQPDEEIYVDPLTRLNLPLNVATGDVRVRLQKGGYNLLLTYAYKANDPCADNNYIYKSGNALMLSGSYSQRGMSFLLQAKRSDNMAFRSARTQRGTAAFINNMPAFAMQHTYALSSLYPYATQVDGEWAFQAEARYVFKRYTKMGGKYGTSFKLNLSYITGLEKTFVDADNVMGTEGYSAPFFGFSSAPYYTDINLEFSKKLTKTFSFNATYMYQIYNQKVIEGKSHNGDLVKSHIGIVELKYQPSKKVGMRGELQYLYTQQDLGQWMYASYELSLLQSLMLSVSDLYNVGETNLHYPMVTAAYTWKAHRIQVGYGKTRAGYNCAGGVCRYVPASRGVYVSYNVNF